MKIVDLRDEPCNIVKAYFNLFYDTSIFTWEGLIADEKNFKDICEYLKLDNPLFYIFSGKQMNDIYQLTGNNKYADDLTLVSLQGYYDPMMKLKVGARWFDDIVDNNNYREGKFHEEDDDE